MIVLDKRRAKWFSVSQVTWAQKAKVEGRKAGRKEKEERKRGKVSDGRQVTSTDVSKKAKPRLH